MINIKPLLVLYFSKFSYFCDKPLFFCNSYCFRNLNPAPEETGNKCHPENGNKHYSQHIFIYNHFLK